MNEIASRHPRFQGNPQDLIQFELLSSTPVRSDARERALRVWDEYKAQRQFAAYPGGRPRKKAAHMRALVTRAIDLTGADLDGICVGYVDLRGTILDRCSLRGAWMKGANLENASLRGANLLSSPGNGRGAARLLHAFMRGADLSDALCTGVDFSFASLNDANLAKADLTSANLSHVGLVRANIDGATLRGTRVYGVAAWDLQGTPKIQEDLAIFQDASFGSRPSDTPSNVTVDNLELAQFVNLLMRKEHLRDVIDTIGQKGVLILGRFTSERKHVLDLIRARLRELGFLPMMFDFERPTERDFTETIKILAGLSRFIIADITNPKSSPLELQATMPDYMVPFVPIIAEGEEPFAMFRDLRAKYGAWVLDVLEYDSPTGLVQVLEEAVVKPAIELGEQLALKKAEGLTKRHIRSYR